MSPVTSECKTINSVCSFWTRSSNSITWKDNIMDALLWLQGKEEKSASSTIVWKMPSATELVKCVTTSTTLVVEQASLVNVYRIISLSLYKTYDAHVFIYVWPMQIYSVECDLLYIGWRLYTPILHWHKYLVS